MPRPLPLLLPLVTVAAACVLPSEPVERLDLSISLSSTRMRPDSAVIVRVTATNNRPYRVTLETTGGCVVSFRLIAPGDADVRPALGCRSILRPVDLGPGESTTAGFTLLPRPRRTGEGLVRWPAGMYQVVGVLLDRDMDVVRETEPVQFVLVCGDPAWTEC